MGFKAVISKKSTNKSKMIAERFSNWLKEKEEKCFYRRGGRIESGKRASSPLPRFR